MATQQPQQVFITTSAVQDNSPDQQRYKKIVRNLGITEVVIGIILIALGCASIGIVTTSTVRIFFLEVRTPGVTAGEGIWGGIWILVAGGLGIGVGKENSSRCLVNTHMAFSIIGSITSFSMTIIGIAFALISLISFNPLPGVAVNSLIAIFSFICFILLIVSASYCCAITGCCKSSSQPGQVVYTQQSSAQQKKSDV